MTSNRFEILSMDDDINDKGTVFPAWREVKKGNKYQTTINRFITTPSDQTDKSNKFGYVKKKTVRNENRNFKKILCSNMIGSGACPYGNKCVFAHNLDDQSIDSNRQAAYKILISSDKITVDLQKDHYLYRSLLGLTNMCESCSKNKCKGGYNCKYGACAKKYHVCIRDLQTGDCVDDCGCVHLTERGLKPFKSNQGTLLTSDFFAAMTQASKSDDTDSDYLSDISDDDSVKSTMSDSECYKSIFDEE